MDRATPAAPSSRGGAAPLAASVGAAAGRLRAAVAAHPDLAALALVMLVAAGMRLAFAFRSPVFLLRDSASYFLPAWDLVHGLGFDISIRRPPVYPGFLAGTIWLFGEELLAIAFAQHLLGILTAGLVYVLGVLTFGRVAGLLAGLLTALNGALLISEHYVMPETLLIVLLLLTFVASILAIRRASLPLFGLAGALLGLAILCKPVAQVLVPVVPIVALVCLRSWRRTLLPTALFGAGVALVIVPWAARNWAVHGSATTAGALGQTLVARTAKHDRGFDWYDPRRADAYERREGIARQIVENGVRQRLSDGEIYRRVQERFGMTDAQINAFMRDLSLEVILAQPAYYAEGTLRMTGQLLVGEVEKLSTDWKTQNARLSRDEWPERVEHLLSRATTAQRNELATAEDLAALFQPAALGPILPLLGLLGLALALARPALRPALLFGLSALAILVISAALDGPVVRYRYPADPLIALLAAGGVTSAVGLARRRRRGRAGRPAEADARTRTAARPARPMLPSEPARPVPAPGAPAVEGM